MRNDNINYLNVPENIKYLSDWKDLNIDIIGKGHLILNKKITGCGATSYFLNHPSMKVILCSPRILLLKDKYNQGSSYLHWFRKDDVLEEDINQITEEDLKEGGEEISKETKEKISRSTLSEYKDQLRNYLIDNLKTDIRKILVTYDSLCHVLDTLTSYGENLNEYTVVVDEFHSIFQDCNFKADTELSFLKTLQKVKNVIYLSATPILKEYIDEIPELKKIPYYELKWPNNRLIKANINRIESNSLLDDACKVINSYLLGIYPSKVIGNEIIESKEAVLFFNSVIDIIRIIKRTKIKSDQVNILCANNEYNKKRLKKLKHFIGKIPKEGEPHKMFTFCTRTSFLGTDFYSTCASTFVFSNPRIKFLNIDISMDLPQIIGRQRLETNPFRHDITLYYKTTIKLNDREEFNRYQLNKLDSSNSKLKSIELLKANGSEKEVNVTLKSFLNECKFLNYSEDYLGFTKGSDGKLIPKINELVRLSEKRSWEIQQMNFKDGYSVLKTIEGIGYTVSEDRESNEYVELCDTFNRTRAFDIRMKEYCKFVEKYGLDRIKTYSFISAKYHKIYNILGPIRLKAISYREKDALSIISLISGNRKLIKAKLINVFKVGDRRTNSEIKNILGDIYKSLGIKEKPKASDLKEYFEVKRTRLKGIEGLEILSHYLNLPVEDKVTIFETSLKTKTPKFSTVDEVLRMIEEGEVKKEIERIRSCKDKNEKNILKLYTLPTVCWNGEFTEKGRSYLKDYSSFIAIDIDKIGEDNIKDYKERLKKVPYVKSVFISPSGDGLKVICQHGNNNPKDHKELFLQIIMGLELEGIDMSVSDLARGNYLSYDPDIYINPKTESFKFIPSPSFKFPEVHEYKKPISTNPLIDNKILTFLENCWYKDKPNFDKEGNRHSSIIGLSLELCRSGVSKDRVISYMISKFVSSTFDEVEAVNAVNYAYTVGIDNFGKDRERLLTNYNL